ncbi:phosphodiester glycosidase family protein [Pendulispora brunnea]|uniref:Phosphodiester glycosidase family protein n=1 Tax=Pendulispora brunnea TaxID=2905690 RepID=A0ABZ2JY01_9BACT
MTSRPFPGVLLVEGKTRAPASAFHASIVSLCASGIRLDATATPTALRTVPSWATRVGAKLALNGDFFKPAPRVYGIAVGGGIEWPIEKMGIDPDVSGEWYYDHFGWIAVGPGWVDFTHTGEAKAHADELGLAHGFMPRTMTHDIPPGTLALVSGFPELVTEGTRYTCANPTASTCFPDRADMRTRNPRTAMGLSFDRSIIVFAVVDGRSSVSAGMYGTELAELMEELGAWQAFNLDGGGSSEMWLAGRGTISAPSDGRSRAVANHWGVFVDDAPAAHCAYSR